MQKKRKKGILPYLLIFLITFFVWRPILSQSMFGEGYYYFDKGQDFISPNGTIASPFVEYDIFPRMIFDFLPPILGDSLSLYMGFQLVMMILLNFTLFFVLSRVTKNRWLSLAATIFFAVSYVGSFEMLGTGNYQRFVQRVPQNIFILLAFLQLHYYLEKKKIKKLMLSFIFFSFGLMLGHFVSFTMPLFFVYPFVWALFQKNKIKTVVNNVIISAGYFVINYLIIHQGPHYPTIGVFEFLSHWQKIIDKIILQIANLTIPEFLVRRIATVTSYYSDTLTILTLPIIALHVFGYFLVARRLPKLKVLYLTSLLLVPLFLLINLYFGKVDPGFNIRGYTYYFLPQYYAKDLVVNFRGDRYYFIPLIFLGIMWAILIRAVFIRNYKKIFALAIFVYVIYNTNLIWRSVEELESPTQDTKSYIAYIKSKSSEFSPETIIATTRFFIWPSPFVREFYGYDDMQFRELKPGWDSDLTAEQKQKVFVIDFDDKKRQLVDKTADYRKGH